MDSELRSQQLLFFFFLTAREQFKTPLTRWAHPGIIKHDNTIF